MSTNLNSGTYTIGDNLTEDFPSISVTSIDPGYIFTTNNTGASSWNWGNITTDSNLQGASIQIKGDAEFDGEVTIKGKNIADMFAKIEERLSWLASTGASGSGIPPGQCHPQFPGPDWNESMDCRGCI